jgi:hypothetical protein
MGRENADLLIWIGIWASGRQYNMVMKRWFLKKNKCLWLPVGPLSTQEACCYVVLCVYVVSSTKMKVCVEDSSWLDYAVSVGTSVTVMLKDVSITVAWDARNFCQADRTFQPRRLKSSPVPPLWGRVILWILCTLHMCVSSLHSVYVLIVNLVPYFPSNDVLPKLKMGNVHEFIVKWLMFPVYCSSCLLKLWEHSTGLRMALFRTLHKHPTGLRTALFRTWRKHSTSILNGPFSASSHRPVRLITGQFIPTNHRPVYSDQSQTIHPPSGPNKRRPHGPVKSVPVPASLRSFCFLESVNQIAVNK